MLKVLVIIGTRPEAIKLAPVILELKKRSNIETVVCTTGQHREMLHQVLHIFQVQPDFELHIMQSGQELSELTAQVVRQVDTVLKETKPNLVLIQGDTTTIMASAMACFYNQIRVGHVEAGLRSYNLYSPFPEEMNRKVASVLASYHFAPTNRAKQALLREGVVEEEIFVTGNTVIDALNLIVEGERPVRVNKILEQCGISENNTGRKLILVTAHRRENFGNNLEEICYGLQDIVARNKDVAIVYPVHLNPHVQETVYKVLNETERVFLIDPVEYDTLAHLMSVSTLVLTDSGGIQEEAPSLGKPVLVMRTETERPEGVEAGTARLVGPDRTAIVQETESLLHSRSEYLKMARTINPYGDGQAAKKIVDIIEN
ncbi:MAG: UDP-N-acetylglucosamine 2-epimerase (non-hydrolyzing) [Desulfohalobiaceae bacterium]|nr:UDP-N-acetylglucosamine 2-epimerase (non-hydrolyzing) [Desulfohalobiaceae bacterium]